MELFKTEVVFRKEKSEKTGKEYICYELPLTSKFKVVKFLDAKEQEIVRNSDLLNNLQTTSVDSLNDVFADYK